MILPLFCLLFIVSVQAYRPDDVSAFFLKAPKSVPRAGRSAPGGYDSFFLKASKSVPRVGRRDGYAIYPTDNEIQPQLVNYYDKWQYYDNAPGLYAADYVNDNIYNKEINMATTPLQLNDENLPHRSRRYNLVPYAFSQQSAKDANKQSYQKNVNGNTKENDEAHYQSD